MKHITTILRVCALVSTALLTAPSSAAIYEFHFTGQYTLVDNRGAAMDQQPISSTLTYDDAANTGFSAGMTISDFDTFGHTANIHDISLQRYQGTNLIVGNMLGDWNGNEGVPISMVWDASGLFNALDYGLQAQDVISGTYLKRNGTVIADVGSATPASDGMTIYSGTVLDQGPAPLAMTTLNTTALCSPGADCIGNPVSGGGPFTDDNIAGSPLIDSPFAGLNVNFDIGSGNSLTVLSVSEVPIPAAAWLFGSGLLGLIGMAWRRTA